MVVFKGCAERSLEGSRTGPRTAQGSQGLGRGWWEGSCRDPLPPVSTAPLGAENRISLLAAYRAGGTHALRPGEETGPHPVLGSLGRARDPGLTVHSKPYREQERQESIYKGSNRKEPSPDEWKVLVLQSPRGKETPGDGSFGGDCHHGVGGRAELRGSPRLQRASTAGGPRPVAGIATAGPSPPVTHACQGSIVNRKQHFQGSQEELPDHISVYLYNQGFLFFFRVVRCPDRKRTYHAVGGSGPGACRLRKSRGWVWFFLRMPFFSPLCPGHERTAAGQGVGRGHCRGLRGARGLRRTWNTYPACRGQHRAAG